VWGGGGGGGGAGGGGGVGGAWVPEAGGGWGGWTYNISRAHGGTITISIKKESICRTLRLRQRISNGT